MASLSVDYAADTEFQNLNLVRDSRCNSMTYPKDILVPRDFSPTQKQNLDESQDVIEPATKQEENKPTDTEFWQGSLNFFKGDSFTPEVINRKNYGERSASDAGGYVESES